MGAHTLNKSDIDYWKSKQLWTLIEASCLLSGKLPQKFEDLDLSIETGGQLARIYADLKDSIDLKRIEYKEGRTRALSNRRVIPSDVTHWAKQRGFKIAQPFADLEPPVEARPLRTVERDSLLIIIAALCQHAGINPQDRGASVQIEKITEQFGLAITDDTIRKWVRLIPDAIERGQG